MKPIRSIYASYYKLVCSSIYYESQPISSNRFRPLSTFLYRFCPQIGHRILDSSSIAGWVPRLSVGSLNCDLWTIAARSGSLPLGPTGVLCFNSTLVRFKQIRHDRHDDPLIVFQFHIGSIQARPESWHQARPGTFQFHIGSIQAANQFV